MYRSTRRPEEGQEVLVLDNDGVAEGVATVVDLLSEQFTAIVAETHCAACDAPIDEGAIHCPACGVSVAYRESERLVFRFYRDHGLTWRQH